MRLTSHSHNDSFVPFELSFNHKPHIVLSRLLNHARFELTICKSISILPKDQPIMEQLLEQLKDFVKEREGKESELGLEGVSLNMMKQEGRLSYDITRTFIQSNKLLECLSQEERHYTALVHPLLLAYLQTINLNHILCSANNLFLIKRPWDENPIFQFNFTSIGFTFDLLRGRVVKDDLIEYANYLPSSFFLGKGKERFNFGLKVRSFAINLLIIILGREINFLRYEINQKEYNHNQLQQIIFKVHSCFEELLDNKQVQNSIKKAQASLKIDLLKFFKTVILLPQTSHEFKQFNSWVKIVKYFNFSFFDSYKMIFQLEKQIPKCQQTYFQQNYLQGWLSNMWKKENKYVWQRFSLLGIVVDGSKEELILYLLYRFRLINKPHFRSAKQLYHPQFIKLIMKFYSQIMVSDYVILPVSPSRLEHQKDIRNNFLAEVLKKLSESLTDLSVVGSQKGSFKQKSLIMVSKESIDIKKMMNKCWYGDMG